MYNIEDAYCFLFSSSPTPNGILSTKNSSINVYLNKNIVQCNDAMLYLILEFNK